jgi:sugar O-acyltransferase (sialic acid O-acetyltransferase NeuD family)
MSKINKYYLPAEDVNDEKAIIVELYFEFGDAVKKGELIYSFETTKAIIDVEAEYDGFINYFVSAGDEINVGSLVCEVSKEKTTISNKQKTRIKKNEINIMPTKKAISLAKKHGLVIEDLGLKGIVKEKDLQKYIFIDYTKSSQTKIVFSNKDLVVLGIGGHAKMCIESIKKQKQYKVRGNIVERYDLIESQSNAIGCDSMLPEFFNNGLQNVIIGIGDIVSRNKKREYLYNKLQNIGFEMINIIDEASIVEKSASIGDGNQIMAGAIIGSGCTIGNNNIINTGVIICHDTKIENNVHIAPGAIIAADVIIGNNTLIGMGATVYRGVRIGSNVLITNGQHVFSNIQSDEVIS